MTTKGHYSIRIHGADYDQTASDHRTYEAAKRKAEALARSGKSCDLMWVNEQGQHSTPETVHAK